ncbi:hypothetical protein BGZ46_004226, partial [Entomortierella lignicola]
MLLALLALLAGITLAAASTDKTIWKNKRLQDWDNGWDVNINGEPVDPNVSCFGRPCIKFKLTKPAGNRHYDMCKTSNGIEYICSNVPENATLLDNFDDFDDFSNEKEYEPKTPQVRQTRQKRSTWDLVGNDEPLELNVWAKSSITYSIAAAPGYKNYIGDMADILTGAFSTPVSCRVKLGQTVCKPAKIVPVEPVLVSVGTGTSISEQIPKDHDELLEDIYELTCTGSDVSQYIINDPDVDAGGFGAFNQSAILSQCEAVRVPSDPDYLYAMQSDGNFVSYNSATGAQIWSTKSGGNGTAGGYNIIFQEDGNLVIYDNTGSSIWSSQTWYSSDQSFRLNPMYWEFKQGNMALCGDEGQCSWGTYAVRAYLNAIIKLSGQNLCLDAGGNTQGGQVQLKQCNGTPIQMWVIASNGNISNPKFFVGSSDSSAITTSSSQPWALYADGSIRFGSKCLNNNNGKTVTLSDCNGSSSQQWSVVQKASSDASKI